MMVLLIRQCLFNKGDQKKETDMSENRLNLNWVYVSHNFLKISAALVWYTGGIILILKGSSLIHEALGIKSNLILPVVTSAAALILGFFKAHYLFNKSCRKNLVRISKLTHPRFWDFYRPVFFLFLSLMILTGSLLSNLAHTHYYFLLLVALLDFSIATALLWSSHNFWKSFLYIES